MGIQKKTSITLLILGAAVLLLFFFVVNPIFSQIKRESENLVSQKKELAESEAKIKNIHDFNDNFKQYQPDFKKIDQLFIDISEPIEFIEFLEKEATSSHLSIEIAPPSAKEKNGEPWPSLEFNLNLKGRFPDFLKFLDKLESSLYLIKLQNMNVRKISDKDDAISVSLLIKVYAQ